MKKILKKMMLTSMMILLASCGEATSSAAASEAKKDSSVPASTEPAKQSESAKASEEEKKSEEPAPEPAVEAKLIGSFFEPQNEYVMDYEGSSYTYEQRHFLDVYDDNTYMFVYMNEQIVTDSWTEYGNFLFASFGTYTKTSADPEDEECTEFIYNLSLPERLIFTDAWNWGANVTLDSKDEDQTVESIIATQTSLYYNFSFISFAADIAVQVDTSISKIESVVNAETATAATATDGGAFKAEKVMESRETRVAYDYEGSSFTYDSRYLLVTFPNDRYEFTYLNQQIVTDSWTDYGSLCRTTFGTYTKTSADPEDEECTDFNYVLNTPDRVIFTDAWNWGANTVVDTANGEKTVQEVNDESAALYYSFMFWPTMDQVYATVDENLCLISAAYGASLIEQAA